MKISFFSALVFCVLAPVRASAEPSRAPASAPAPDAAPDAAPEAAGETIVIVDHAPAGHRDRATALHAAPFVTILHPGDHPATASVADALATSAGAHTRSLGGLGAYQSVSIRGAAAGHTAVLVDGVPLSRLAEVTTDLGRFAMASFGQVELYRGAVPLELGGAGVGGAVNLITRLGRGERGEQLALSLGGGSFGARHLRVRHGDTYGDTATALSLGYQGATGRYSYFSDGGTPLNPDDDHRAARDNNGFDQLDLAARAGATAGDRVAGVRVAWKQQGLPGSVAQPARAAELSTLDAIVDGRLDLAAGAAIARQTGFVLVEHQVLRDPAAELGLGAQARTYRTLAAGAASTWTRALARHRGSAGLELRGDAFRDADRDGTRAALTGHRAAAAASAALDLALLDQLSLAPSLRVDVVRTAPTPMAEGPDAFADVPARWDTIPSPRLTAHALLTSELAVKGSAGWYVRLPTLVELFGNRGTIVGSPDLAPERGPSADLGVVWAPARSFATDVGPIDRVLVEAAGFATRARDTIALITTAGFVARAANIGATRSIGGELVASARFARALSLTASYTRLRAVQHTIDPNLDGRALPRTPGHAVYARADLAHTVAGRRASLWFDTAAQSTSYLDQTNFQRVPARVLLGAGARVDLVAGLAASASVANLAGTRVVTLPPERAIDPPVRTALADLAGFPLPGRSFYLALDWTY